MNFAVIIPSRSFRNLAPSVYSIWQHEPGAPVIVVHHGEEFAEGTGGGRWLRGRPLERVEGIEPFIFSRNVNLGIRSARAQYDPEAFVIMNDDALLVTPGGFTRLAMTAAEHPDFGIVSAVTNAAGNPAQLPRNGNGGQFREEPIMLCFVCVLITAKTIDAVGLLDERFTAYGWEDNDYCRRAKLAGFRLGIEERCFVDHCSLESSFRPGGIAGDISAGREIYRAKWGNLA